METDALPARAGDITIGSLPATARALAEKLGRPVYIVGGWVRDALMGISSEDIDIASSATPEELERLFGARCDVINRRLGTVKLRLGDDVYEHTALRREEYAGGGAHTPSVVALGASVAEDALRRDFSVNALYLEIATGRVLDPTGKGIEDIARRRLRTTTDDPDEILSHDGLRIMRMVRLCAEHDFLPDRELLHSAKRNAHLLRDIAPERIKVELTRMLMADAKRAVTLFRASGALAVVIPELMEGAFVFDRTEYHKFSVLTHNLMTCASTPPLLALRLAGLLHDVGKPESMRRYGNLHYHDRLGAKLALDILRRLRFDKKTCGEVYALIANHMFDLQNNAGVKTIKRKIIKLGPQLYSEYIALREADVHGSGYIKGAVESAERHKQILEELLKSGAPLRVSELKISGDDIVALGVRPGPLVRQTLERLLLICATEPSRNTRRALIKRAAGIIKTLEAENAAARQKKQKEAGARDNL